MRMRKTVRAWTVIGGIAGVVLASAFSAACSSEEEAPKAPEAEKLIEKDPVTNTVDLYVPNDGKQVLPPGGDAQKAAMDWLDANKDELGIPNPKDSFTPIATTTDDEDNTTSVKLQQTAGGLPVWGVESVVHFDDDGSVSMFDGPYIPNLDAIAKQAPKIDAATALANAKAELLGDVPSGTGNIDMTPITEELVVYVDDDYGSAALARHVTVNIEGETFSTPAEAFVDAMDGHILDAWVDSEMIEVSAEGLDGQNHRVHVNGPYEADQHWEMWRTDGEEAKLGALIPGNWLGPKNTRWRAFKAPTSDGPWDRHAVSAELNVHRAERFYQDSFKWNGPNGKGSQLFLGMHFNLPDNEWNAFAVWSKDGKQDTINFTDRADGKQSGVVAIDVCGHEFTHLVTHYNSKLVYARQAGAINEAMSDVFGAFVERFVDGRSNDSFLVAEATGEAIRDMRHPHSVGEGRLGVYADNMGELHVLAKGEKLNRRKNDNGYVHYNSSIVNNAWSLQVEGGVHDTTRVVVSHDTGWDKSARLWWKTQRQILTRRATIKRMARAQTIAAQRSHGRYDIRAVACSWAAVKAIGAEWVEQKLHLRCDGVMPPAAADTKESCAGKSDGVYCSTHAADVGYICKGGVVTTVKCNDNQVCKGAYDAGASGDMIVQCVPK